jgi:hypothetical protein
MTKAAQSQQAGVYGATDSRDRDNSTFPTELDQTPREKISAKFLAEAIWSTSSSHGVRANFPSETLVTSYMPSVISNNHCLCNKGHGELVILS